MPRGQVISKDGLLSRASLAQGFLSILPAYEMKDDPRQITPPPLAPILKYYNEKPGLKLDKELSVLNSWVGYLDHGVGKDSRNKNRFTAEERLDG